jgi:hypothetical protein
MKKILLLMIAALLINVAGKGQGCVAVRNISGFGQYNLTDNAFSTSDWQLNINTRYFKSFRDFRGKVDLNTPKENEAVVKSYSMDISIGRILRDGWSLDLSIPFTANSRSSTGEHGGLNTKRRSTHSFGIGDVRFTAYKWLLKPSVRQRGNIQLGLGVKLPTGDYKYQDYFYRNDSTRVFVPVNPSIQLGDGGTGIITELNTFYIINATRTLSLYGNFYYMANPREQNGTPITNGGRAPSRQDTLANNIFMSVPDLFSVRVGIYYNIKEWAFSAGIRNEGSPVNDVLGGSEGVRRAGHVFSVEPGIVYKMKKVSLYTYVPVTIGREVKQNVPDKFITNYSGVYRHNPGGSGNYQVFLGALFKL